MKGILGLLNETCIREEGVVHLEEEGEGAAREENAVIPSQDLLHAMTMMIGDDLTITIGDDLLLSQLLNPPLNLLLSLNPSLSQLIIQSQCQNLTEIQKFLQNKMILDFLEKLVTSLMMYLVLVTETWKLSTLLQDQECSIPLLKIVQ